MLLVAGRDRPLALVLAAGRYGAPASLAPPVSSSAPFAPYARSHAGRSTLRPHPGHRDQSPVEIGFELM